MNDTVVIALSRFLGEAERVAKFLGADVKVYSPSVFSKLFPNTRRIVAIMSLGIVVRRIAPLINNKWNDPAVVVVSHDLAFAIPVFGGHHGANELA
jgi:cobalt-precorrin 5A hydrolase